jgi:hypothetical protein
MIDPTYDDLDHSIWTAVFDGTSEMPLVIDTEWVPQVDGVVWTKPFPVSRGVTEHRLGSCG